MKHNVNDFIVNQFARSLDALRKILVKAQGFAEERKFDENLFLQTKLAADMFTFSRQVQITCDSAKGAVARLSGQTPPAFADDEKTVKDLIARIDKTLAYIRGFSEKDFENYAAQKITFPWNPGPYMMGDDYLVSYALPTFYFHLTTAYALLRSNGVALGKADYLGELNWRR